MKDFGKHWYRYLLGILIGGIVFLFGTVFSPELVKTRMIDLTCKGNCQKYLKMPKDSLHKLIAILDKKVSASSEVDEKINSLNTRINDFYIFAGILVTLILIINVSVYIRTASEVQKHMAENFESHKEKMEKHISETAEDAAKIRGLLNALQNQKDMSNSNTPQDDR